MIVRTTVRRTEVLISAEINLRQQLGETDLPEKLQPVNGVLM